MEYAKNVVSKKNILYECKKCDYICSKKFLYNQHCKTKKHLASISELYMPEHICSGCKKVYKHKQSLNRHKKRFCIKSSPSKNTNEIDTINNNSINALSETINTLIKQNVDFKNENKEMREMIKDIIPNIGNNNTTINNKFNLQVFLNEECKDAINFDEFINTLQLDISDLDITRQYGYINGMSNIFIKGLRQLDLHKRPIHCSDLKREILYIKDNNSWEKNNENQNFLKNAINTIAKKQIDIIKEWEYKNPNWNTTEEGTLKYIDMIRNAMNVNENEDINSNNKIIKTIAKEVSITKEITTK
jgi:hypothetical protein